MLPMQAHRQCCSSSSTASTSALQPCGAAQSQEQHQCGELQPHQMNAAQRTCMQCMLAEGLQSSQHAPEHAALALLSHSSAACPFVWWCTEVRRRTGTLSRKVSQACGLASMASCTRSYVCGVKVSAPRASIASSSSRPVAMLTRTWVGLAPEAAKQQRHPAHGHFVTSATSCTFPAAMSPVQNDGSAPLPSIILPTGRQESAFLLYHSRRSAPFALLR